MNEIEYFLDEGIRRGTRKNNRQVSSEKKYEEDLENHNYGDSIIDEIKKITQLFKERKDSVLRSKHNSHELDGPLNGFSSVHLYPGEFGDRDIVILYRIHRDDHVVLHKIGSHGYVYGKDKKIYEIKTIKTETKNDVNGGWMGNCVANDISLKNKELTKKPVSLVG